MADNIKTSKENSEDRFRSSALYLYKAELYLINISLIKRLQGSNLAL